MEIRGLVREHGIKHGVLVTDREPLGGEFLRSLGMRGSSRSAGRLVTGSCLACLLAKACGSAFTTPGGRPYLHSATSMVAWARFFHRPNLTLSMAWVPTI